MKRPPTRTPPAKPCVTCGQPVEKGSRCNAHKKTAAYNVGYRDKRFAKAKALWAGRLCARCGLAPVAEVHHIVPLSRGGTSAMKNLVGLCRPCHYAEHGKNPPERME